MDNIVVRSKAPLRLGLAGGGTDLSPYADLFGGAVLNATINLFTYATIETAGQDHVSFHAIERQESADSRSIYPIPLEQPLRLHKGVYNRIVRDFCGGKPFPMKMTTHSDAPAGSGLGTSSTLVVAMVNAYKDLLNLPLGEYEIAHLAYDIERNDCAYAGGRQDQYAATFGGVNFMEFAGNDKVIVNPLRIRGSILHELNYNLLLYHTGTSRSSSAIIERQIEEVGDDNRTAIAAMHHLKEQAILMKEALLTGRLNEIGRILDFGWQYKKRMAEGITNPSIDELYETMKRAGVIGGKISGAGGGGFMMLYIVGNRRYAVMDAMKAFGGWFLNYQFCDHGVEGWRLS
jgi:D-glycero-alpha-D-manno-heptose-7-phosphate kinase